jgi:hypothetical protein
MNRNLFTPTSVEDAVVELDTFRNDILGAAAFSFGLTALQFQANQAPSIATAALVFLMLWAALKVIPKYSEHKRLYDNLGFWAGHFRMFRTNLVLFAGLLFLIFVAGGVLTLDRLLCFSLAKVFVH